jgi:hypothetical protein
MKNGKQVTLNIDTTDTDTGSVIDTKTSSVFETSLESAIKDSFKETFVYEFEYRDNLTLVTIEPLVKQVEQVYNNCIRLRDTRLDEKEREALEFTLQSTNQVYHFLTSLLAEAKIKREGANQNETKH